MKCLTFMLVLRNGLIDIRINSTKTVFVKLCYIDEKKIKN